MMMEISSRMKGEEPETHTVTYDKKPSIQAIATTSPDLPSREGNGATYRDYEYVRHGTQSLLAGLDLVTGEAIPLVRETHKRSDFIEFLKILDSQYPKGDKIRLVLDNHSAHTSKETRAFLATIPGRFEFVFTPQAWFLAEYDRRFLWEDDKPNASRNTGSVQRGTGESNLQVFR